MPGSTVTLIAADDEPAVLSALVALVGDEPRLKVVGTAGSGDEAIALAREHLPRLAVLDLRMPSGGPEAVRGVRAASPGTRVVVLSAYDDAVTIADVVRAGANGFLSKGQLSLDLPGMLLRCAAGEVCLASEAGASALDRLMPERASALR